jgi:hypothetical protein
VGGWVSGCVCALKHLLVLSAIKGGPADRAGITTGAWALGLDGDGGEHGSRQEGWSWSQGLFMLGCGAIEEVVSINDSPPGKGLCVLCVRKCSGKRCCAVLCCAVLQVTR